jgi:hypothetical protein
MTSNVAERADADVSEELSKGPMTVALAVKVVGYIALISRDDEIAHSLEDDLHLAVLKAIADGHADAAELARVAAGTATMNFARWCA